MKSAFPSWFAWLTPMIKSPQPTVDIGFHHIEMLDCHRLVAPCVEIGKPAVLDESGAEQLGNALRDLDVHRRRPTLRVGLPVTALVAVELRRGVDADLLCHAGRELWMVGATRELIAHRA